MVAVVVANINGAGILRALVETNIFARRNRVCFIQFHPPDRISRACRRLMETVSGEMAVGLRFGLTTPLSGPATGKAPRYSVDGVNPPEL